jgi:hypothetical protein
MHLDWFSPHAGVTALRGNLPIILTCPHGGGVDLPDVALRTHGTTPDGCFFSTSTDLRTIEVTRRVAGRMGELTGLWPYVAIAEFPRSQIDANRTPECAYAQATASQAAPFYHAYHQCIDQYVSEIASENNGTGFLFDIHGTGGVPEAPADVYLGTVDGETLLASFNRADLFRRHGLAGLLLALYRVMPGDPSAVAAHYAVFPADAATPEVGGLRGGYTVREYSDRVNAIQLELGPAVRESHAAVNRLARDLASAMLNFVRRYAPF